MNDIPLYHWSPASRRKQIIRYGLRPSMKPTTSSDDWKAPYVCFADSPSWAWALSGDIVGTEGEEWDLWQTWMSRVPTPKRLIDKSRPSGLHEVRTYKRVMKSKIWYAASRMV